MRVSEGSLVTPLALLMSIDPGKGGDMGVPERLKPPPSRSWKRARICTVIDAVRGLTRRLTEVVISGLRNNWNFCARESCKALVRAEGDASVESCKRRGRMRVLSMASYVVRERTISIPSRDGRILSDASTVVRERRRISITVDGAVSAPSDSFRTAIFSLTLVRRLLPLGGAGTGSHSLVFSATSVKSQALAHITGDSMAQELSVETILRVRALSLAPEGRSPTSLDARLRPASAVRGRGGGTSKTCSRVEMTSSSALGLRKPGSLDVQRPRSGCFLGSMRSIVLEKLLELSVSDGDVPSLRAVAIVLPVGILPVILVKGGEAREETGEAVRRWAPAPR